jgi:DNA-binding transcriptional MerR regulator
MTRIHVGISDLSRQTGVSIATIKYYVRLGLLAPGRPTGPKRSEYDDAHAHRLRLIRTLREVGGLGIERIGRIVAAIDDPRMGRHDLYGVATRALEPDAAVGAATDATIAADAEIAAFLDKRGWIIRPEAAGRRELAATLVALRRLGRTYGTEAFEPYADIADRLASWEVQAIPASEPPGIAVERMVVGTVLFERILGALRRLAHEHHSRDAGSSDPDDPAPNAG